MNIQRMLALLAAVPLAIVPASALAAEQTVEDSSAEAVAADVGGVVTISETAANTAGGGSASAHVVKIGSNSIAGGTQEGEGSKSGNLGGGAREGQGHVYVAPWEATVNGDRSSSSRAAVLDGNAGGDGGVTVIVLESKSQASRDGSSAESTGAYLNLGGNEFRILHARTASDGSGETYLVNLAGNKIGTNEQFDGRCAIPADPVANLNCLRASELTGDDLPEGADGGGQAYVGDLEVLDGNLTSDLFSAGSLQGGGGDDQASAPSPNPGPADDDEPAPGPLPRTGAGLGAMLAGLAALASGERLRRWKR